MKHHPTAVIVSAALLMICASTQAKPVGIQGPVGCLASPKEASRLEITKPGVYENYRIDGAWGGGNRVKITADNVTLRNCEIFNCGGNGVGVYARNVTIENCHIHHCLQGTYQDQKDAHGITGRWADVTIRNCEIHHLTGDAVQFDPDREMQGRVTIEDCTFWTGPLAQDMTGFKKGERPGENALDTKTPPAGERCVLNVRNCHFYGWNQPAQIDMMAALNLKEHIQATVEGCVFSDNQVALRLRGPGGRGDARISVVNCAIYDAAVGVRMEDKIAELKLTGLAFGPGVVKKYQMAGGGTGAGFQNEGEREAPEIKALLKDGFPTPAKR